MNIALLNSRIESKVEDIVYRLGNLERYSFDYDNPFVVLEVVLNKSCLNDSTFKTFVMIAEYIYAFSWHVELLPIEGKKYNQFKLCFLIDYSNYDY